MANGHLQRVRLRLAQLATLAVFLLLLGFHPTLTGPCEVNCHEQCVVPCISTANDTLTDCLATTPPPFQQACRDAHALAETACLVDEGEDVTTCVVDCIANDCGAPSAPIPGPADLDGDGDVDVDDIGIVVSCFGQFVADNPACAIADVAPPPNGDGVINILDISFVGSNFTL